MISPPKVINFPPVFKDCCVVSTPNCSIELTPARDSFQTEFTAHFDQAVTMLGKRSLGFFHFPVEYVSHFYDLQALNLNKFTVIIDRTIKQDFQTQWLDIVCPGLKIVTTKCERPFYAKKAVVLGCGGRLAARRPQLLAEELRWVQKGIKRSLNLKEAKTNLLLIKRNETRVMTNWETLKNLCVDFCKLFNLRLDIFDDSRDLGTVSDQLHRFNAAKIIVGSHGAGFTNILGCDHGSSFLVDFKLVDRENLLNENKSDPPCFRDMAKTLGVHYQSVDVLGGHANLRQAYKAFKTLKNIIYNG